jgi:RNA polymerase sigma-70 factor, ECF subfamily
MPTRAIQPPVPPVGEPARPEPNERGASARRSGLATSGCMLGAMRQAEASRGPDLDPEDLGSIYQAYAETVSRWARRLAGTDLDLEDLLHDVFMVAQRRLPEFRGEAKITTWLFGITVRVVQNRRRRRRWRRWLSLGAGGARELAADGPTPLQALETRQAIDLTYALLEGLREADRTVLVLFELEGLSGQEIAAITGTSTASVWVRLHRARARLREAFLAWERRKRR